MTSAVRQIIDAAMPLSSKERAEIAAVLIESLNGPAPSAAEQAEIDAAWRVEIRRRMKEIEDGTAELIPGDEFLARVRERGSKGNTP
jgi:putative addiction module component (TIGR02574 family)